MILKKIFLTSLTLSTLFILGYIFFSHKNKLLDETNSMQETINKQAAKAEAVILTKTGSLFEDNVEDGNFVLPPKLRQQKMPNTVTAEFKSIPRSIAELDADQAIEAIGRDVPNEWIAHQLKSPSSVLSTIKKQLSQLPKSTSITLKNELFSQFALYEYQRDTLSKNRDLQWQASEVAGWKIGIEHFKNLATLLNNEEYKAMLGVEKNSIFAKQITNIPHPYDDTSGPSSEVFATLPIRQSTHGLIKTEQELFQYVDPSTVLQITNLYKTGASQQLANQDAYESGQITDEERIRLDETIADQTEAQVKTLLTPDQAKIFGLESLFEDKGNLNTQPNP